MAVPGEFPKERSLIRSQAGRVSKPEEAFLEQSIGVTSHTHRTVPGVGSPAQRKEGGSREPHSCEISEVTGPKKILKHFWSKLKKKKQTNNNKTPPPSGSIQNIRPLVWPARQKAWPWTQRWSGPCCPHFSCLDPTVLI